ncbi:MAG: hydrogenase maturation nickel metallochaperone HypA [Oscillospiraceae bacterium]|jgi:hydrogenase nickel incorporation protein HypA/HybF|nr:hydrogenase maturation nickel metallochaperone HypA [Oscillospiraceae bacterium]
MHELGIMTDVLDTALRAAEQNGGRKVTKITLKIGLMSGVMPAYVQSFFDVISKDTIAAGAEITIVRDPAVFVCRKCGVKTAYTELGPEYLCQSCGSRALRLSSGYGFQIVSVGIL